MNMNSWTSEIEGPTTFPSSTYSANTEGPVKFLNISIYTSNSTAHNDDNTLYNCSNSLAENAVCTCCA